MSESLESTPEIEQQAVPNNQIKGEDQAKNYNPFPTISMALGKSNVQLQFKCDYAQKKMYTVKSDHWQSVDPKTLASWAKYPNKKYHMNPDETAEQIVVEPGAKYPDGTFKYYKSYTIFKRMMGSDGIEYLVRSGWLHGISFMNIEWKYPKDNFDWHYEPVFEPTIGGGTTYEIKYGEQTNQIKVYHTPWNTDTFDKSLRDIPYPNNTSLGVGFKVGVEGAMGVTDIPSLQIFKNKSFNDLYQYATTGDKSYLEFTKEELEVMTPPPKKKK